MKKTIRDSIFVLFMIMLLSVFSCACANSFPDIILDQNNTPIILPQQNEQEVGSQAPSFKLPSLLTTIEDSAFEGTALNNVNLPENLKSIEDNAFANIPTLTQINIPNSTTFIGKNAFKGSNHVTITAAPKSYARAYAQENKIPFNPIESFYAYNKTIQITGLSNNRAKVQELILEGETTDKQRSNPTGRMAGELNADRYEGFTAFHIQGRSPPMG